MQEHDNPMATVSAEHQLGDLIRQLREHRRLSVRTLAAKAGFSPSFLSQVENGLASPSIASLEKIAAALEVTLVELFQAGEPRSSVVVRARQRPKLDSGWSKARIESLGPDRATRLEPVLITLRAGGTSGKKPHSLTREQFVYVVSGEVTLVLAESRQVLTSGDAVTLAPQTPFRWINDSISPARMLAVSSRAL
ncbi:MAG: helix-turn-helix transcriptional regulator [Bryobacterales bacterium]|nr:helix-turn-helix transcriptional regulator [Bryobacterales bacterium]